MCPWKGQVMYFKLIQYPTWVEAFMVVMFQVEVFWVVTLCSVVVGYQHFRGPCCHHHQRHMKCGYPTTISHGVTTQKTSTCTEQTVWIFKKKYTHTCTDEIDTELPILIFCLIITFQISDSLFQCILKFILFPILLFQLHNMITMALQIFSINLA
jgi:hypothetical protein